MVVDPRMRSADHRFERAIRQDNGLGIVFKNSLPAQGGWKIAKQIELTHRDITI